MPKGSKGQKNGLTFYILTELMPELARTGQVYPNGFRDLIPIALPRYQNLPHEVKERYEMMAKAEKAKKRQNEIIDKRDNLGNLISQRVDPKEVMKGRRLRERNELLTFLDTMSDSELMEEKFYFVGFQYMICTDEGDYYPLEFGLVEWNMIKGVSRTDHGFIDPGPILLGYRYRAQAHGNDTHRIPIEKFSDGESDYQRIWKRFESFLGQRGNRRPFPPMYCMESDLPTVEGCLSWLHDRSGLRNYFRICIIEELITYLLARKNFKCSDTCIIDMLTTSCYDFEANTKCSVHDEVEAKHCALGLPKKYTYAISDSLSEHYNYQLTPSHVPVALPGGNTASVFSGEDKSWLVPVEPTGRGRGKTTVEPVTFASRDIRYSHLQKETPMSAWEEEEEKEEFSRFSSFEKAADKWNKAADAPYRFANTTLKAPAADALPSPSRALLNPPCSSKQSCSKISEDSWVMATQYNNMTIQNPEDARKKVDPSSEMLASKSCHADTVVLQKTENQTLTVEHKLPYSSPDEFCEANSSASNHSSKDSVPSAFPTAGQVGRGRSFANVGQTSNFQILNTPARVGMIAMSENGGSFSSFSPAGRGRAFISYMDRGDSTRRPPPGFGRAC